MTDELILKLFLDRNEQAIAETNAKYGNLCRSIAANMLGDASDAEECVNDTFNAAWNRIPPDLPRNFAAYLGRLTRNISITRFRQNHALKRDWGIKVLLSELEECLPSSQSVEEQIDAAELTLVINRWLSSLNETDRVLFVRRYWFGDTIKELSQKAYISPAKVSQKLFKLRTQLKNTLKNEGVNL